MPGGREYGGGEGADLRLPHHSSSGKHKKSLALPWRPSLTSNELVREWAAVAGQSYFVCVFVRCTPSQERAAPAPG